MEEIWKFIEQYGMRYQVSTLGNVRSSYGRVMKLILHHRGYLRVQLTDGSKRTNHYVSRLVAFAFLEKPKKGQEVCHLDGNKTNNRVDNLRLMSSKENSQHALKSGFCKYAKHIKRKEQHETDI